MCVCVYSAYEEAKRIEEEYNVSQKLADGGVFFCHVFFFWLGSSYGLQADAGSFIVSFNKIFFFCMTARLLDTRALNANSRFFFFNDSLGMQAATASLRASAASLRLFKSVCGSEVFFSRFFFVRACGMQAALEERLLPL